MGRQRRQYTDFISNFREKGGKISGKRAGEPSHQDTFHSFGLGNGSGEHELLDSVFWMARGRRAENTWNVSRIVLRGEQDRRHTRRMPEFFGGAIWVDGEAERNMTAQSRTFWRRGRGRARTCAQDNICFLGKRHKLCRLIRRRRAGERGGLYIPRSSERRQDVQNSRSSIACHTNPKPQGDDV